MPVDNITFAIVKTEEVTADLATKIRAQCDKINLCDLNYTLTTGTPLLEAQATELIQLVRRRTMYLEVVKTLRELQSA